MTIHLCFHGIGTCAVEREPGESRYWVAEGTFLRTLDQLRGRSDLELSFDDGNRSDVQVVLPALQERGLRATFFPIAGRLDDPASLHADDLVALREAGMRIGSHGWQHVPWRRLTDAEAQRELVEARLVLAAASGAPVTTAALPLGRYDRAALRRLKDTGYRAVYTSDRFPTRPTAWLQARYSATAADSVESLTAPLHRRPGLPEARNRLASAVKRVR